MCEVLTCEPMAYIIFKWISAALVRKKLDPGVTDTSWRLEVLIGSLRSGKDVCKLQPAAQFASLKSTFLSQFNSVT